LVRSQPEKEALLTKPTLAAAYGKRNDDAVADSEVFHFGAQFDYLAHVFVAEYVPAFHGRLIAVEEMEVRAADGAGGDLDDCIAWMLDLRIGNFIYPNVAFSVPTQRAHCTLLQTSGQPA
jgi:hypothetical protein